MDATTSSGIAIWILLLLLSSVGSVARTVADLAHDLQPELFAAENARVRALNAWGSILSTIGVAGVVTVAIALMYRLEMGALVIVFGAGLSVLIVIGAQGMANKIARGNFNLLARVFFGHAAPFLSHSEEQAALSEPPEVRDERMEQVVDAGEKAGLIEMDEYQMITGIIHLDRTRVRDIMVPRIDVVAIEAETPFNQALDTIISHAVSRVPVYEGSIDHIVGLLYARDLLKALRDGKTDAPLPSLVRPAHFVPESKRLDELLQELQKSKVHMAIVVDEYGGTAGIVTIEDVLEEIVGEIQDEYDTGEEPLIERVSDREAIFDARATIDRVNATLSVKLPHESDTIGGLVLLRLEKMPKGGDQIQVDNVTITVLSLIGRRVKRVRVIKVPKEEYAESSK